MSYILIIHAEDGSHYECYASETKARAAMSYQVGRDIPAPFRRASDDWGRRIVIEDRPNGWSVAKEKRLNAAYNARECGTETASQLAFLSACNF
jgi:hypothetical protein